MTRWGWHSVLAFCVVGCWSLALLGGCAHTRPVSVTVQDDPGLRITIIPAPPLSVTSLSPPYDQPARLSPETLERLLGSIRVEKQASFVDLLLSSENKRAWEGEHLTDLAAGLSRALEKVGPDQAVAFYESRARNRSLRDLNSGAVLVKEGRLVLVLANYHYAVDVRQTEDRAREDPLYAYPDKLYGIVPQGGQTALEKEGSRGLPWKRKPYDILAINLASAPPEAGGEAPASPDAENPKAAPPSIETRLETLQRLYERGLITEDEYKKKKKELLEGL